MSAACIVKVFVVIIVDLHTKRKEKKFSLLSKSVLCQQREEVLYFL